MTVEDALTCAIQLFEAGDFSQAQSLALSILDVAPQVHRAHQVLGGIGYRRGEWAFAEQHLREALRLSPGEIDYQDNLCSVLNQSGQPQAAEAVAREIVRASPARASGWNGLGLALKAQQRWIEAESAFRESLRQQPQGVQALNNLANVVRQFGRASESEAICRQALLSQPQLPETWLNLGTALHDQARYEEALTAFDQALAHRPNLALAQFNRGVSWEALNRLAESERAYVAALVLQPDWPQALNNLGIVLKLQGRLEEAIAVYRRAVAIDANYMVARTNLLAALQCDGATTADELLVQHREWDRQHARGVGFQPADFPQFEISNLTSQIESPARPLRIGFVSPDFGNHPVGRFLIAAFERFPPDVLRTYCYSDRATSDEITQRFIAAADEWIESRLLTDDALAQRIRDDRIDILIDLAGHTGHHRLMVFARKPAAVQASWIGYPGTTGLSAMDWIIADNVLIPPSHERFYSERVARLPTSYVSFEAPSFAAALAAGPAPCLTSGQVTFGSFNKLDKTTPEVLRVWADLLQAVPQSRLVLGNKALDQPEIAARIRSHFEAAGVAAERVDCRGWMSHAELLATYQQIDIALDTFPFSGGSTSADALWMGVPLVTLAGDTFASRQSASLMVNAGLDQTIAASLVEYREFVLQHAAQASELTERRRFISESFRAATQRHRDDVATGFAKLCREMSESRSDSPT